MTTENNGHRGAAAFVTFCLGMKGESDMIFDRVENAAQYSSVNPYLNRALALLGELDLQALPMGKTEIDGDRLFLQVLEAETVPASQKEFEFHRRYADIHVMLSGAEYMEIGSAGQLRVTKQYSTDSDIGFGRMDARLSLDLVPGWFCVCLAQDAHLVGAVSQAPQAREDHRMKKIVMKVRLDG